MLFQAYVATKLAEDYEPESTPILALEEPEAHLHPSAIRSLGSLLENMVGQTIVSSHSGDLLSRVPVTSLRRLYKKNEETKIGRLQDNLLTDREIQAVNYFIRLSKGHYLFSRCWLLVEGESDFHIMPMLFELMGYSQDQISFSVLEFSQVFEKGESFIKLAQALGIQWFMMADGDAAGRNYVNRAGRYLENGENLADRARQLISADIEHEFWNSGYEEFIKNMVTDHHQTQIESEAAGDSIKKTKLLIKAAINKVGGKPAFAQRLADEVERRGIDSIPQIIQDIMTRVVQLAGN
jgi:putative ATP-dependent endonuclease of OLD family